jgi:hypothetical protein
MGMAKKTKKKPKAKAGKGSASKMEVPPDAEPVAGPPAREAAAEPAVETGQRKGPNDCAFCGKPMRDLRTRMIHERNCRSKAAPAAGQRPDLDAAILEVRDRFQDQVEDMTRQMREREEHHQRELEEVKTVLRMEIDRHRKELERLSKVERDVAHAEQEHAKPLPAPEPEPAAEEPPRAQARDERPKAIDMLPLPAPRLPRRRERLPEEEAIPEIGAEEDAASAPAPGLDRAAVEAVVRSVMAESASPPQPEGASRELAERADRLASRLDHLDQKLEKNVAELHRAIERIGKEAELKRVEKELEKISERVLDIMEDSGFGESLSVSKIPPTILEIVYQAIIDDVYLEIMKTKGAQDAERIARAALEEVRLKTSGSELFKFDGRKIVTDNLAKSIDANLISAKQIQTTYDVLLERLLETVPHHKSKNFKGMIKVKSQEFAVDRATRLTREYARLEKEMENSSQMMAALSSSFGARSLELHEAIADIRDRELASKADREEVAALRAKLDEANERCARLADELALMRARADMISAMPQAEPEAAQPAEAPLAPGEEPFVPSPDIAQPGDVMPIAEDAPPQTADEIAMQNEAILSAVGRGASTRKALLAETGLAEDLLTQRIAELVARNKLIEKRTGKRTAYTTLERELGKARDEPGETPKKGRGPAKAQEADEAAAEPIAPPEPGTMPAPAEPVEKAAELPETPRKKGRKAPKEEAGPEPAEKPKKGKKPPRKQAREEAPPVAPAAEPEPETPQAPGPAEPVEEAAELPETPRKKGRKAPKEEVAETSEEQPEKEREPDREGTISNDLPVVRKSLEELSDDEAEVLGVLTDQGLTVSGIQSKVGKHMKRFALLRALRVLIDSGHVGIVTKGRMELYCRVTVEKMDTKDIGEKETEVK